MNEQIKNKVFDKIVAYDRIIICRHIRPDGDAVGSSLGLYRILKASFPQKEIFLDNNDRSDYLAFLGDEGEAPAPSAYSDALVIALDTATADRISNSHAFDGKELLKIDHHIEDTPYGDFSWVEDTRSSASEMIADFYVTFRDRLVLGTDAAACLYCGMVTDSGRFRFRSTSPDTLRLAAVLLEQGIDTETIYSNLYMNEYAVLLQRAELSRNIRITENGVAWIDISTSLREKLGCTQEDASNSVTLMETIKGSLIWIAFIENGDGTTRVRLRSRYTTIRDLATRYHGGGHACASGATVYSEEEKKALLAEADAQLASYKAENTDWI